MPQLAFDDLFRHALHRFGDIGEKSRFLAGIEKVKQSPRLAILIIFYQLIIIFNYYNDGHSQGLFYAAA